MLAGRTPTVEEEKWMRDAASIGCIVCLIYRKEYTPPEIHHIDGKTKPGCHLKTIPLCTPHHRRPGAGYVSRHGNGKKAFEAEYMPEEDLLLCTQVAVQRQRENTIGGSA